MALTQAQKIKVVEKLLATIGLYGNIPRWNPKMTGGTVKGITFSFRGDRIYFYRNEADKKAFFKIKWENEQPKLIIAND